MRRIIINTYLVSLLMLTTYACKTKSTGEPSPPKKATLTFPERDAACTTGTSISPTQSSVVFTWIASEHTDSYEMGLKNLLSGQLSTYTSHTNQLLVSLEKNTPYSWYIVSKSTSLAETATSEVWKFYNAGPGSTSHAPFPAEAVSPTFAQSISASTVDLKWTSGDVDGDIVGYDIYMGTNKSPALFKSNVTDMFLHAVSVSIGNTYYWKVISKDGQGNTSDSELFQFNVN